MNLLEELHKKIDEENWNVTSGDLINRAFQELNDRLIESGAEDLLRRNSEKEREVFSFNKTTEGIKWKLQGKKSYEDGTQEPYEWPDTNTWTDEDYNYILERFKQTENAFVRSEYGAFLFLKNKLTPLECLILFNDLLALSGEYYEGMKGKDKPGYYGFNFQNAISLALRVAYYKKNAPEFTDELDQALLFVEHIHSTWQGAGKYLLRTIIDLTNLALEYYDKSSKIIKLQDFFERNNLAAEEQIKTYTWGGIYIIDVNITLAAKLGMDIVPLIKKKAELYEKLADERQPGDLATITFIETALRLYKEINDLPNVERVEGLFKEIKTTGAYNAIHSELPKEESNRILENIENEIASKSTEEVLMNFVFCPMYLSLDTIKEHAENWKGQSALAFMAGASISDKFGNTIANYPSNSDEWAFMQAYQFQFQIGTQSLIYYFLQAFKVGKITADGIFEILRNSWMGEPIIRNYNNQEFKVMPIDLIKPAITHFLDELEKWKNDPSHNPELILTTDSLVVKIEALLRYFCDRLGLTTFKLRSDNLVMEQNLDEILAALEAKKTIFDEDDRRFIKFVLSEKAGENLRNRIAHGLMDSFEYSIDKTILAFTIILRLAKYNFKYS